MYDITGKIGEVTGILKRLSTPVRQNPLECGLYGAYESRKTFIQERRHE
jgi:hypothetical protein